MVGKEIKTEGAYCCRSCSGRHNGAVLDLCHYFSGQIVYEDCKPKRLPGCLNHSANHQPQRESDDEIQR